MLISLLYVLPLLIAASSTLEDNAPRLRFNCTHTNDSLLPLPHPLVRRRTVGSGRQSVSLIGLFDVHEGGNCHLLNPAGMEQVMMTIGVLENRWMQMNLSDIDLGFDVYDTCSNTSTTLLRLVYALQKVDRTSQSGCASKNYIGVVGPMCPKLQQDTENLLQAMGVPYFPLQLTSLTDEIKAISEVLLDLKWKSVALFTTTRSIEDEFRSEADKNNICIAFSTVFSTRMRSNSYLKAKFQEIAETGVQVVIVLGSNFDLRTLYEMALMANTSVQYWLLAGIDTKDSLLSILFGPDHPVIFFRKPVINVPNVEPSILETYDFGGKVAQLNLVQSYMEYVHGCINNTSGSVLNELQCQQHQFRTQNPQFKMVEGTVEKLLDDLRQKGYLDNNTELERSLELNQTQDEVEIWTFQHAIGKFSKHKELQVGHYMNRQLIWDKKLLNVFQFTGSGWFKIPEFHCYRNCKEVCKNFVNLSTSIDFDNILNRIYHWQYDSWVTVLVTISGVGTLVAIVLAAYLVIKSCREDYEEGNQVTNVIILVAVIFSYSCTILFMLNNDSSTCTKRIMIVGIAYVSILAPVLSRCFLIIAAEIDGVHAHVSGFLQSMLCFFIFVVQIAMAAYYWVLSFDGRRMRPNCAVHLKMTLSYLSYPMLLSFLWLITSPFCIRIHRNNREGLLLHLGSIAVCVVWLIWYLLFFLLHPRWNEFTICFGLVATATAVLVAIFLPKVYRMIVSTAARDSGQVSMQPVIFASASSRSPNLSIYESINHGYNPDKDGFMVDVFRDEDDSPHQRKSTHL